MNLPVLALGLVAFFLFRLRNVAKANGSLSAMPDVDCSTYRHPEWRRGVGQRWIPATHPRQMGVVCGYHLVRVNPQTGERIYTSFGTSGGNQPGSTQTGQDPDYREPEEELTDWERWWKSVRDGFTDAFGGFSVL